MSNPDAEMEAISALVDQINNSFKNRDVATLTSSFTEDAFFCGSDPAEFWNKEEITAIWTQMLNEYGVEIEIMGDRKIQMLSDGKSAMVIEQYMMPAFSNKIPFRNIYHAVRKGNGWMIDFSGTGCIPRNEDLPKMNEALAE